MYRSRKPLDQIQSVARPADGSVNPPSEQSTAPANQDQLANTAPRGPARAIWPGKQFLTTASLRPNGFLLRDSKIARGYAHLRATVGGGQAENLARTRENLLNRPWPLLGIVLIIIWLLVLLGLPVLLPSLLASWLTFVALLITPGFLLTDMITRRLGLDELEQLALALPFGVAILALPGMAALLFHWTLTALALGWIMLGTMIVAVWLLGRSGVSPFGRLFGDTTSRPGWLSVPWAIDELMLLFLLVALFILIFPTLSLSRIDGDAYAVNTFAVDALAGLPLNAREPLFGTDLGPGVRMVFNQSLPLAYLWSYLAGLDPIDLISHLSRQILALWAILAMYMLGKAAGAGSRRSGLFTAAFQLLIYAAAPFWRGDNVSLYFFERINADKFMVIALLLPQCFALAIRFVRHGHPDAWLAAVIVAFATSTIHPFGAAMLALALVAFSACHFLLNVRDRLARPRSLGLVALAAAVMLLPIIQLLLALGETPLAPSYPASFDGWSLGHKRVPVFPFVNIRGLDLYGPLPRLDQLEAAQANTTTNPFLIWRFAVNIDRQRLIVFDVDHYISDPRLLLEPPYLLALLLLPFLIWRIRTDPAVQFVIGTTLAILFVMFNPLVTPLIGSLVMPWILWRLVWLFPYPLVIVLAVEQLLAAKVGAPRLMAERKLRPRLWHGVTIPGRAARSQGTYFRPALILIIGLLASPAIMSHIQYLHDDSSSSYFYPTPQRIFDHLQALIGPNQQAMVLADQDLSVTVAAYVANANILAHRVPTTSEIFPADQQDVALQRLIDQDTFFRTPYLTADSIDILTRWGVNYVITSSGSDLDLQLQLAHQWFKWQLNEQSYSLYAVVDAPSKAAIAIQGNTALAKRDWATAGLFYKTALAENPGDLLALAGLAEIAQQQGQFDEALSWWRAALAQADLPILHARLGQLYAQRGDFADSGTEWQQASRQAPEVARYHIGLGNVCLRLGLESCAEEQYAAAVVQRSLPDQAARLMVEANLWQQQGRFDQALPLYEEAVAFQPSRFNQYILESAYREAGQPQKSEALLRKLRLRNPFSAEPAIVTANRLASLDHLDEAVDLYRGTIKLEQLQAQDTVDTRLALAQLLLDEGRLEEAGQVVGKTLALAPYSGEAHRLQGDIHRRQGEFEQAAVSYQLAFMLEPSRVSTYVSLNQQLRQHGGHPEDWLRTLQTAVRLNPNEPSLYLALGDQWLRQGDSGAAIDAYLSALENLDPDAYSGQFLPPSTRQGRAFVYSRLAQIYEDQGQIAVAFNYYQSMAAIAPDVPWTQMVFGDAWRRQNNMATAETLYQQALHIDPGYLIAYLRLAEINEARGNGADAATLRQLAMQLAESQLTQPLPGQDLSQGGQRLSLPAGPVFSDQASPSVGAAADNSDALIQQIRSHEEQVTTLGLLTHLYQLSGQTDKAIELYLSTLAQSELTGGSPALQAQYHKGLGDLYLSQGRLDLAIDAYQQALKLDQWWSEARLALATTLITQGNVGAAVAQLQTAVDLAPGLIDVRLALADALLQQGHLKEAQAIYEAAVRDFPGSARAKQALAEFYASHRQPRAALPLYHQALAQDPANTTLYLALSEVWLAQGDASQAQAVLESGLNRVSDATDLKTALSTLFLQQNEPEKALAILGQGISQAGDNTRLLLALGAYFTSRANYDQAAESYQHALSVAPGSAAVQVAMADLAMHRNNLSAALVHYEQAVKLAPAAPGYWLALANTYQSDESYANATAAYSQALAVEPDLAAAYIGLGEVLRAQERWEEAQSAYEQGLAVTPTSAWLLSAYAGFLIDRGDETRALTLLQQAADNVQDVPTMVAIAALYDAVGQKESSEALFQTALAQEPGSVVALIGLGDLYERQGRTADAQILYEKVIAVAPGLPAGYLHLGHLAHEAGDQAAADKYAALAQQVAPQSFGP